MTIEFHELAGIQYIGVPGSSIDCQNAMFWLIQSGVAVRRARILTSEHDHCLLLELDEGDQIAVKSGFSSGYQGEGPSAFSNVLQLLEKHGAAIEEHDVDDRFLSRLDQSALVTTDIEAVLDWTPIRPSRWYGYIKREGTIEKEIVEIWRDFPLQVPFALVDPRIADLALEFWKSPDEALMKGYRRLEDVVRKRTGLEAHGTKLFSEAFLSDPPSLTWPGRGQSEISGRGTLFTAAFMAYRNPRAHREIKGNAQSYLSEFLLMNHLFKLESEAMTTADDGGAEANAE